MGDRRWNDPFDQLSSEELHLLFFVLVVDFALDRKTLKRIPNVSAHRRGKEIFEGLYEGRELPLADNPAAEEEMGEAIQLVSRYVKATVWEEFAPAVPFPLS